MVPGSSREHGPLALSATTPASLLAALQERLHSIAHASLAPESHGLAAFIEPVSEEMRQQMRVQHG